MTPITREQFAALREGDCVRWYLNDGTYRLRTVLPWPRPFFRSHSFPIRQRSWTRRIHTTVVWSDIAHRVEFVGERTEMLMTHEELWNLCERKFQIASCLLREYNERGGIFTHADSAVTSKLMAAVALARTFCEQPREAA